ncbi:MAG: hypothetical protein Q8L64_06910 [bacterium]|nr:hypothetical protein [bacterium]
MHATLGVFAQFNDELIRHSTLNAKEKYVIIRQILAFHRLNGFDNSFLKHPA